MGKYIKKADVIEILNKLIQSRKRKTCSRTAGLEASAFEYCIAIINKVDSYDFDESEQ